MFNEIKKYVLSKLNKDTFAKRVNKTNVTFFLFNALFKLSLLTAGYFVVLFLLNAIFHIQIVRHFMVTIVFFMELVILFQNKLSGFDSELRDEIKKAQKSISYYSELFLFYLNNFLSVFYVVFSFLIAYGIFRSATLQYYFNCIMALFLLPASTIIASFVLPDFKEPKSKVWYFIAKILTGGVSILIYCLLFTFWKMNFNLTNTFYNYYTLYNSFPQILTFPEYIAELFKIDIFELMGISFNIFGKDLINPIIFAGALFTVFIISVTFVFVALIKIETIRKDNDFADGEKIIRNNIKVSRPNFILMSCMPLAPPCK